jgi:hypothetical protein
MQAFDDAAPEDFDKNRIGHDGTILFEQAAVSGSDY